MIPQFLPLSPTLTLACSRKIQDQSFRESIKFHLMRAFWLGGNGDSSLEEAHGGQYLILHFVVMTQSAILPNMVTAWQNPTPLTAQFYLNAVLPYNLLCATLDAQHPAGLPPPDAARHFLYAGAWSRRLMGCRHLLGDAGNNWDSTANSSCLEAGENAPLVGSKGCCRLCWSCKM